MYLNLPHVHKFTDYCSPWRPTLSPPLASSPSVSLSLRIQRQRTILKKESHDLPQIISSPVPPRRIIHTRSLQFGCLIKPNKPNPPHHIPLSFTRPAEYNHHTIDLDPAPRWGELVHYCDRGCWEGFCRWS